MIVEVLAVEEVADGDGVTNPFATEDSRRNAASKKKKLCCFIIVMYIGQ